MKTCFFVNLTKPVNETLKNSLKALGYTSFKTEKPDEIDQAGKQCQKLILFFDEPSYAYMFLREKSWSGFQTLNILILPKKPILSTENQRKLASVFLEVFGEDDALKLNERIKKFEESQEDDNIDSDSIVTTIEFNIHKKNIKV